MRSAILVHGVAYGLLALLGVDLALRIPFPCDLFFWSESPFMTDMLKLAAGLPVYTNPADGNSFVYAPGLQYVTWAALHPLGLALDIRACRVVIVLIGLGAAACAARVVTDVAAALRPGLARAPFAALAFAVSTLLIFSNPSAAVPHPDSLHALHATATLLLVHRALHRRSFARALLAVAVAGLGVLTKQTAALTVVGATAAMLASRIWTGRRAAILVATGVVVAGGSLAVLLVPPWDPLESTCRHASLSIL